MAEEEEQKNEEVGAPEEAAPEAAEEAPSEEPAVDGEAEEPAADSVQAEAPKEPRADEPEPDGSGREAEQPADDVAPAPEDEGPPPTPKQLRKAARSKSSRPAGPERNSQERAEQRTAARRAKAVERRRYRQSKRAKKSEPGQGTPPAERASTGPKVRQGVVISNKADKTITVRIEVARRHPVYEKVVRRSNTLRAHDEKNQAQEGDLVRIAETRPVSKTKRWRLVDVLEKAK